jgi:hypothetical protein
MSNNTPVFEYDAPVVDEPEVLAPTQTEEPEATPVKKNVAARIFAALFVVLAIASLVLPLSFIKGATLESGKLLGLLYLFMDTIAASDKLFGIVPTLVETSGLLGQLAAASVYVLALCLVLTILCGVIAIFSTKNAPLRLRAAVFFFTFGFAFYAACTFGMLKARGNEWTACFEYMSLAAAGVGLLTYFVLGAAKGKRAWVNLIQLLFSVAVSGVVGVFVTQTDSAAKELVSTLGLGSAWDIVVIAIVAVLILNVAIAFLRLQTKKGLALDLIRYILEVILAGVIVAAAFMYTTEDMLKYAAIGAAAVSVLQIVIWIFQRKCANKTAKVVEEEAPVEEEPAPVEEFVREEFAEALPYEGGPVEGVEIAQEVTPTVCVVPPVEVQTAGYDFYNSKSFDPFIAMLTSEERNQFTELFILKYKGAMPEIPDYAVGGDNKQFFRKLFIYLGQYRDIIPDGLLAKIYKFAVRM